MNNQMLRHESGRSVKIIKESTAKWLCVYFNKNELVSNLKEIYKTKKEAMRSANYFLNCGLV